MCGCWDREGGGRAGEAGRCCGAIARGFAAKGLVIWNIMLTMNVIPFSIKED